jgi:hypothetical protein
MQKLLTHNQNRNNIKTINSAKIYLTSTNSCKIKPIYEQIVVEDERKDEDRSQLKLFMDIDEQTNINSKGLIVENKQLNVVSLQDDYVRDKLSCAPIKSIYNKLCLSELNSQGPHRGSKRILGPCRLLGGPSLDFVNELKNN